MNRIVEKVVVLWLLATCCIVSSVHADGGGFIRSCGPDEIGETCGAPVVTPTTPRDACAAARTRGDRAERALREARARIAALEGAVGQQERPGGGIPGTSADAALARELVTQRVALERQVAAVRARLDGANGTIMELRDEADGLRKHIGGAEATAKEAVDAAQRLARERTIAEWTAAALLAAFLICCIMLVSRGDPETRPRSGVTPTKLSDERVDEVTGDAALAASLDEPLIIPTDDHVKVVLPTKDGTGRDGKGSLADAYTPTVLYLRYADVPQANDIYVDFFGRKCPLSNLITYVGMPWSLVRYAYRNTQVRA